jgi:hypothetical protein
MQCKSVKWRVSDYDSATNSVLNCASERAKAGSAFDYGRINSVNRDIDCVEMVLWVDVCSPFVR